MTTHLPGPGADDDAPVDDGPLEGGPLEGGDSVCWLERVCDACGALAEGPPAPVCARCGTARPDGRAAGPP